LKRLIFSLLYENGHFVLSRNFQRQKVGDINWLLDNYNLEKVSLGLDELIVIDVSLKKNKDEFHNIIKKISQKIFIPLTVGGGINNLNDVEKYLKNGADKILLNNLFFKNKKLFNQISRIFGKQFIVGCIDYKRENEKYLVYKNKAKDLCNSTFLIDQINNLYASGAGEIILQSIELDGTGMGIDKKILKIIENINISSPIILKGGIGKPEQILNIMRNNHVEAVCTANLFNFIGDTFVFTRSLLLKNNINIAKWKTDEMVQFKNKYKNI
jgi:cyclase